jgi:Uma2 family endonuclease
MHEAQNMNAEANLKLSKADFYAYIQANDELRCEYVRGHIVQQMTGGTKGHGSVARNILLALMRQLDPKIWAVLQERGVETSETIRFPDVVVEPADEPMNSLSTLRPVLAVEVLSPTSKTRDINEKPEEYTSLASLEAYIVASQDTPQCLVWQRGEDRTFPAAPITVEGRQSVIDIPALGIAIPLADVYLSIGE